MKVTETSRLALRWVEETDAEFIMKLLNEHTKKDFLFILVYTCYGKNN